MSVRGTRQRGIVTQKLDGGASQSEEHERSECRVVNESDDDLRTGLDHVLDDCSVHGIAQCFLHRSECGANRLSRVEGEFHPAFIALVQQPGTSRLEGNGEADRGGG